MYRIPTKEFRDFQNFQRREVAALAKEMVDIVHEYGKEAMMFMGDHHIGTEPFMEEFASIGLDAVVGSVGNGATLRLFSDIKNVKYTEGRFLPYFFPDTFYEGGDPDALAKILALANVYVDFDDEDIVLCFDVSTDDGYMKAPAHVELFGELFELTGWVE